ncbi:MAG: hypothetical protein HRT73_11660 [Flavobacteriales bacterium]|nr:hypothetical protein [Flavobacteriales bacterium]
MSKTSKTVIHYQYTTAYHVLCKDSVSTIDKHDLFCERYYPTGELASTYTTIGDSILYGTYKNYYKNGQLKDSCQYISNFKYGIYQSYYENGREKSYRDYVLLSYNQSYLNQFFEFDSITSKSIEETKYSYWFELNSKEVDKGDSITVKFSFDNPMYGDSVYLEIGNYDEVFMISDNDASNTRIIPVDSLKKTFKVMPSSKKKGENFLRGIIHDFKIDGNSTKERLYYFYYFVD